uniref:Ig-like domain-containing protein n=1 Tax=Suricata suricatta TaxID=37032 RepID=A0A673U5P2_SURSU
MGPGTVLRVTDKRLDADTSPKPTIFLPSMAEIKFHEAGTYLCLLENFFPDVIKIDWKEKNSKRILKFQQANTVKTKDTYMTYTWLTLTKMSIAKEHKCIVKHENNKGEVGQEVLFHSMKKDPLQLQFMNTSAYYTYVLLLVKSMVYSIIIAYYLLGRPAPCDNWKFVIRGGTCI